MQFRFPSPPPVLTVLVQKGQPFTLTEVFESANANPENRVPRLRWLAHCAYPGCGAAYTFATGISRTAKAGFHRTCETHRGFAKGKYGWYAWNPALAARAENVDG